MEILPSFELVRPRTLAELLVARAEHPESRVIGGGTDLMVNIRRGIVAPPVLIDINGVTELRDIKADARALEVRIEVGYGLEGTLTDALSSVIISSAIIPRFKVNDYSGGMSTEGLRVPIIDFYTIRCRWRAALRAVAAT